MRKRTKGQKGKSAGRDTLKIMQLSKAELTVTFQKQNHKSFHVVIGCLPQQRIQIPPRHTLPKSVRFFIQNLQQNIYIYEKDVTLEDNNKTIFFFFNLVLEVLDLKFQAYSVVHNSIISKTIKTENQSQKQRRHIWTKQIYCSCHFHTFTQVPYS